MRITLNLNKSIEQNAAIYYEKAKKAKKKLAGAKKAIDKTILKLEKLKQSKQPKAGPVKLQKQQKKEWFEKFRWFYSSEEFLCVGGRDATSNEILIKKHTEKNDLVFHTKLEGSPFFVIKTDGKKPNKQSIRHRHYQTIQ